MHEQLYLLHSLIQGYIEYVSVSWRYSLRKLSTTTVRVRAAATVVGDVEIGMGA